MKRLRSVFSLFLILVFSCALPGFAQAKNPITSYFSRLFDETRPEIAVGNILLEGLLQETGSATAVASFPEIDQALTALAKNCPRNSLPFTVYVIESPIPGEIPFPGGPIVLTKGTLDMMKSPLERDFVLARNIMHIALRHPMMVLKKENLYGKVLRMTKKSSTKLDRAERLKLLRDYIKAANGMDQVKADREGLGLLSGTPEARNAARDFLQRWSKALFPTVPWEASDLETRITAIASMP